jgi:hypothetical protein
MDAVASGACPAVGRAGSRALVVAGTIDVDTVWSADTISVVGDVTVSSGVTLSIAPGVCVEFAGCYRLAIDGSLLALGTPEQSILFTTAHPEAFAIDSTQTGCWHGIHFENTSALEAPSHLEHCVLEYAKGAGSGARGGALTVVGFSKLRVENCVLRHNVADYGGVLFCANYAAPVLTGSVLSANAAFVAGSAVYSLDAFPKLIANTIVNNEVRNADAFVDTGVIHNHIGKGLTTGNILWENTDHYFMPGQIREGKRYYVTYNDIAEGHVGIGNFDADPLFVDQGEDPYALLAGSACIDAGPPDTTQLVLPAHDVAGNGRIWGGRIDAGAYEWRPVADAAGPEISGVWIERDGPNPFATRTGVRFFLASPADVHISVCDVTGREVARLMEGRREPGPHAIAWDGRDGDGRPAPAGVYLLRVRAGDRTAARALVLLGAH